jgi:hypothetical protein
MKWWRRALVSCAALPLSAGLVQPAEADEARSEYAVKAAFLYNFTKFVEWPEAAFAADNTIFFVCVLGADPFGGALDAVAGKAVGPRQIKIRRVASARQADGCQIVFVSGDNAPAIKHDLSLLSDRAALTVGEMPGFAEEGGVIGFVLVGEHLRLEINPQAAAKAHLSVKGSLLNMATITREK